MRVSEYIGNDYKGWKKGDIITIKAGTGAGKSHFVKTELYEYAKQNNKKILMLVNRYSCKKQFILELKDKNKLDGTITIRTYQSLESDAIGYWGDLGLCKYDYIVCDEMHYFMSDSSFNRITDLSIEAILNCDKSVRIMMSATNKDVSKYIRDIKQLSTIDYNLPINYDFIRSLTYYGDNDSIHYFINDCIKYNKKAIVFVQSAKRAYELHQQYKNYSLFDCSKSQKNLYMHVDELKIEEMLEKEKFNELIFFTTTCNDNGINIIDDELNTIIIDGIRDIETIKQCIGRKRLTKNSNYIDLIIKGLSNKAIGQSKGDVVKKMKMADYLRQYDAQSLVMKYKRRPDNSGIVYDDIVDAFDNTDYVTKKVNEMAYYKCKVDLANYSRMINLGKDGFSKFVAGVLGRYNPDNDTFDYEVHEENKHKGELEEYLDSIVGEKLYKEDQKELVEMIDHRVDGRQQTSYTKLNIGLDILELPYTILPKKSNGKRYWKVEKIDR